MADKIVKLGLDRFLAKEWVDYSLELYLSSDDDDQNYQLLRDYLQTVIPGKESARKTGNQLKRLWLTTMEQDDHLRKSAKEILMHHQVADTTLFNLGMALNVFPIFKETCRRIGELSQLQIEVNKQTIVDRVVESFVNPTSIPRIVARVLQTLVDWELILENQGNIHIKNLEINEQPVSVWFIQTLIFMDSRGEISLNDFSHLPEKMGVSLPDIRSHLHAASNLSLRRGLTGEEIITIKNSS
jgi:sporulation protein YlmC with PRC-barrel domain